MLADLPDASVALIFTGPPYDKASVPLYADLAVLAKRVLVPGGTLVCDLPSTATGEVFGLATPHLGDLTILPVPHEGLANFLNWLKLDVAHKNLGWFGRRGEQSRGEQMKSMIPSHPPEIVFYDWAQSTAEAEYLISKLTLPGELVLDPFCGSGTTLLAALGLGRRALGVEIDEERAKVASARLQADCVPLAGDGIARVMPA